MSILLKVAVVLIVIVASIALYTVFVAAPTLPACDSSTAEAEVARAMEDAPIGRVLGLKLVKITDVTEVSANATERRCSGTAHLTNAQTYSIEYKFYVDAEGDAMVEAQVLGLF